MGKLINRGISLVILVSLGCGLFQLRQEIRHYYSLREVYLPVLSEIRTFSPGKEPDTFYVRCMVNEPLNLQWLYSIPTGTQFRFRRQGLGGGGNSSISTRRAIAPGGRVVKDCQWTINLADSAVNRVHDEAGLGPVG